MKLRLSRVVAGVAVASAIGAPAALGQTPAEAAPEAPPAASQTQAPAPATTIAPPPAIEQGATIAPPTTKPQESGGVEAGEPPATPEPEPEAPRRRHRSGAPRRPVPNSLHPHPELLADRGAGGPRPDLPTSGSRLRPRSAGAGGPRVDQRIETAFGSNINTSSAGAIGWMQFMPETWEAYGVDANGDGVRDPYNPEDAIFAAAPYLSASGIPEDAYGAIFAYNHADWYVADVLAGAACRVAGGGVGGAFALTPQLQVLRCEPGKAWRKRVPTEYIDAFEGAAARYGLGRDGVWALAAVARLESNFGKGMGNGARTERTAGPRRNRVEALRSGRDDNGRISAPTPMTRRRRWPA